MDINLENIFKKSVGESREFHFFVDELTSEDVMPTFLGESDEIYSFERMDDDFFNFLNKKSNENGIYIRLVYLTTVEITDFKVVYKLEYGNKSETYNLVEYDEVFEGEFADYGIKVKKGEITLGTTIEDETPHFEAFTKSGDLLSLDNPLIEHVVEIIESMIK